MRLRKMQIARYLEKAFDDASRVDVRHETQLLQDRFVGPQAEAVCEPPPYREELALRAGDRAAATLQQDSSGVK